MRYALIRLEDVGPGGHYETAEQQTKLDIVGSYLLAEGIPYHVAVISRYVDPVRRIDRTIAIPSDPVTFRFVSLLRGWAACGVSLGMHGYTHQFGASISGEGYEFAYPGCPENCPPDDSPASLGSMEEWRRSYACGRFRMALSSFLAAGLRPDWFETPHYAASSVQRRILDDCSCLIYEDNPDTPGSRTVSLRESKSLLGHTCYVPTPLGYVDGTAVEQDVNRILRETDSYGDHELASFFFHPFLEFPSIRLSHDGTARYDEQSPLHRLIGSMKKRGRRFVSIDQLLSRRFTN